MNLKETRRAHSALLCVISMAIASSLPVCASPRQAQTSVIRTPNVGTSPTDSKSTDASVAVFGKLPLRFEENVGQTDLGVQFISRGPGYTLFLTPSGAVFKLSGQKPDQRSLTPGSNPSQRHLQRNMPVASVLRMTLEGTKQIPTMTGVDKLPGVTNYLIGKDPRKWHTGIASYSKVQYSEVYSGIDLVYYGNQHQLEYDFVVKPGADPGQLSLGFEGSDSMDVSASGDMSIHTKAGELSFRRPKIYQIQNGQQINVSGGFRKRDSNHIGFDVAKYDQTKPLVIDPVLVYSTYLGGSSWDYATDVAVDSSGDAYISGDTWSVDFPIVGTSVSAAPQGGMEDGFVAKLNSSGTALIYSTYLGGATGSWGTNAFRVAVDSNGQAYVSGNTSTTDFPVTSSAFQTSLGSGAYYNAYLAKLSASGQTLLYSTFIGGTSWENEIGLAVGANQNAYVVGQTGSSDFPTTSSAYQTSRPNPNLYAGFLARINTTLSGASSLIYSTYFGGSSSPINYNDGTSAVAVDANQNAYLTGWACTKNFPVTASAYQTTPSPTYCAAFLSELSTSQSGNSSLIYSTYLGGTAQTNDYDTGWAIGLDSTSKVYVSGTTDSPDFPTTTGVLNSQNGKGFVSKFDLTQSGSSSLLGSTLIGGSNSENADALQVDSNGNIYLAGGTWSTDFPVTADAIQTSATLSNGASASFFSVLSSDFSNIIYSTYFGGDPASGDNDGVNGLALDQSGNAYLVGATSATDFETTTGAVQPTAPGGTENGYVGELASLLASEAPTIASSNSTTFVMGASKLFTVITTGSPAPGVGETGSLPSGITFNASSGALTGTPAEGSGGTYSITFTASNGVGSNATQSFTLTVDQPPAITSSNGTTFVVGVPGSFTVTASGFPAPSFAVTGTLPSGVALNTSTGVLSGTPAAGTGGQYSMVLTASNGVGSNATQNFTLSVDQPPAITSGNQTNFVVATAGSFTATATGYPASTFSESGALPSGVTLSSSGVLSGTPAAGTVGGYPITITASDGVGGNATQNFTLAVLNAGDTVYYYFGDELGSTRVITDSNGNICYDTDYYPFGGEHGPYVFNCSQNYKFTGKERDSESSLDDFGARYMSSQYGRFMTPDAMGNAVADPSNPQTWNLYSYVLNNPLKFIDPTGNWCVWEDNTHDDDPNDGGASHEDCDSQGGHWDPGDTITGMDANGNINQQITVNANDPDSVDTTPTSFADCVKQGGNDTSVQHAIQWASGGRFGNGWLSSALFGNPFSGGIQLGQDVSNYTGQGGSNATSLGAGLGAGPAAEYGAKNIPNVTVAVSAAASAQASVATASSQTVVAASAEASAVLPIGQMARTASGVLGKGLAKLGNGLILPVSMTGTAFAATVCSIGR